MSKEQNNKIMVPSTKVEKTIMIPAKEQSDDLMIPPKPISVSDEKLNVAGGENNTSKPSQDLPKPNEFMPKPPEMKVMELKEGGFVKISQSAICETEEEAEKLMPPPPFFPHGPAHRPKNHDASHKQHNHHGQEM